MKKMFNMLAFALVAVYAVQFAIDAKRTIDTTTLATYEVEHAVNSGRLKYASYNGEELTLYMSDSLKMVAGAADVGRVSSVLSTSDVRVRKIESKTDVSALGRVGVTWLIILAIASFGVIRKRRELEESSTLA